MSYEQHMRHSRNHRKDRFVQQCSGYGGSGEAQRMTEEQARSVELISFQNIVYAAQGMEYPIYVVGSGGFWSLTTPANLFATEIDSFEELLDFGGDMVDGFLKKDFLPKSVDERLSGATERSGLSDVGNDMLDFEFEKE